MSLAAAADMVRVSLTARPSFLASTNAGDQHNLPSTKHKLQGFWLFHSACKLQLFHGMIRFICHGTLPFDVIHSLFLS